MNRTLRVLATGVLAGAGALACGGRVLPPSVILISIDTLRPDHLGCYGHASPTSPTLDALAASGVRFADVTAAAPWTLPSHATMLTGLWPSHHGVKTHETRLSESVVTVAEEFRDHGYETFAVVNTHNVGAPQFQLQQGFGEHFRYINEMEEDPRSMKTRVFDSADTILLTAKEFLRARDPARPFFLFLHFYDVHTDFTPREEYRARFVGPYAGRLTGSTTQLVGMRDESYPLEEADVRWLEEMYDAEIRQLDDTLGRFFDWLRQERLFDGTYLAVTSDHGEEFQEHGSILHGRTHYQEVLRIPLILSGPGLPAGTVVATPVSGVDVTPTLLGLAGIPTSVPRDGLDLSPTWRGGQLPARDFFGEADHNNVVEGVPVYDVKKMVRSGELKLLTDVTTGASELYDLGADPGEHHDLAQQRPQVVGDLRARLERFMAEAVRPEVIAGPSDEERRKLKALGY